MLNEVRKPKYAPKTMISSAGYMISPSDIHDLAQLFFPDENLHNHDILKERLVQKIPEEEDEDLGPEGKE